MSSQASLRSFNLNTLPVLREILRHGSVGKAALSLHVSQPALSAALKQLRHQFGDELIIRSNGSMKLTPKAEAMLEPLEQALAAVQQFIQPAPNSSSASRTVFRIATNDHIMNVLGAPIAQTLLQEDLQIVPHFLSAGGHSAEQLLKGELECIIMPKVALIGSHVSSRDQDSLNSEPLYSEPLVGIYSGDEMTFSGDTAVKDYLEHPHVSLVLDSARNISVERAFLAGHSLLQNDVALFSNYVALIGIVASTKCIALVPASLANATKAMYGFRLFTPPIDFPKLEWTMIWHRRNDKDEKLYNCRQILKSCARHVINKSDAHLLELIKNHE